MRFEKISRCSTIWRELFINSPNSSPFLSYEWFYALCDNLLKTDPKVMIFQQNDRPVGIFPAIIENGTLKFFGDERVTDIIDIIYVPGYEHQIIEELASFIMSRDLRIDLFPLEGDSPLIEYFPELVADVMTEQIDLCPMLSLPDSWEGYLNNLNGKLRHELRRKLRKAIGVKIRSMEPEHIGILFKLMSDSDRNKKKFLTNDVREFFKTIANSFFTNRWLRFQAAFLDTQPVGTIFSFQTKDRIYLYNTGFDPEFYHLSPGIVTIGLDIKAAIDEGKRYYDFLRGGEAYKFHFGAEKRYTVRLTR